MSRHYDLWPVALLIVLCGVIVAVVMARHDDCARRECPEGMSPKLVRPDYECLCVTRPR